MEQVRDFEIQLPPWYKRIELIHTQIASAAVFGSCLIIQIFNFYLSMLIFASDTGNYFGTGLCLISVFTGILSLLGLILSRIFHSFDSKKRLWKIFALTLSASFITMAAVHIYFASTISSYKSAIVSELSDPIECQNSETFSSFSMIYIEAKNTGCSGDIRLCVCYQQDECFRDRKDDLETLKQIENTFKCGGICNLELPMFYEGATNESCMDGIVDAIENLGLISSVSLSMGSTFAFLGFFSVVFMAIYKKKPLYKIEKHKNVNESSVWDLMQSRFDKSLGTIHTRRKFVRSPQRNPSPSPIDVMPSFVDDENAEERSEV